MDYTLLSNTDVKISRICLGTMTWGEQNTQDEGFAQMDCAVEHGINFFDAAEMYPVPPRAETYGATETIIGHWFAQRKCRDKIILATKVAARAAFTSHIREGGNCLDRKNILAALEGSLQRLQTDYIDLYQIHWPERPTNFFGQLGYRQAQKEVGVPIEETLEVLDEIVKSGKVRYIGVSNETAWGVAEYLRLAREEGRPRIVSIQNPYNLLNRSFEIGLAEFSHREQVGLLAYSPLGFGVLSGKYIDGARPEGARLSRWDRFSRYVTPRGIEATAEYVALAREAGLSPSQMALAFVNQRPFVTSNIIGATSLEQLQENIASSDMTLPKDLFKEIEAIHERYPNPCP